MWWLFSFHVNLLACLITISLQQSDTANKSRSLVDAVLLSSLVVIPQMVGIEVITE